MKSKILRYKRVYFKLGRIYKAKRYGKSHYFKVERCNFATGVYACNRSILVRCKGLILKEYAPTERLFLEDCCDVLAARRMKKISPEELLLIGY